MKHLQVTDDEMLAEFHGTISLNVDIHFLDSPTINCFWSFFQANIYILNFKKKLRLFWYKV